MFFEYRNTGYFIYRIQPNDTIYKLANNLGTTINSII